jgi:hypothetical protein
VGDTTTRPLPKLKKNSELAELIRGMSFAHLRQAPTAAPKENNGVRGDEHALPVERFFFGPRNGQGVE